MMKIEYDENKRKENIKKHKIDFKEILHIFDSPLLKKVDDRLDYGENRIFALGQIDGITILAVIYVYKAKGIKRLISARRATKNEQRIYYKAIFKG